MATQKRLVITPQLYQRALTQTLDRLMRGKTHITREQMLPDAKRMLDHGLWLAFEFQCTQSVTQMDGSPLLSNPMVPEDMKKTIRESHERTNKQFVELRRVQLIKLLRTSDDLDLNTATELVDEIIQQAAA
jgi:hypothetical protein